MKVKSIETLTCDAGWRNYHFVKLVTEDGIVGWSEFDEGFGSPGVGAVIERLAQAVEGEGARLPGSRRLAAREKARAEGVTVDAKLLAEVRQLGNRE